jgi:hypothetical protein
MDQLTEKRPGPIRAIDIFKKRKMKKKKKRKNKNSNVRH